MKVGILGCTGLVGQKYISLLKKHPFFEIGFLSASEKNVGKRVEDIPISSLRDVNSSECVLFFSALPSSIARSIEMNLVKMGKWIVSSSSTFRTMDDVPVIIPEINAHHLSLLEEQQKRLHISSGGIVSKPNCTLQSFLLPLYPLHRVFGLQKVVVTNLQAISGAGKSSLQEIVDTIYPYIPNEEEKTESEPGKILENKDILFSSHCVRVPVLHGHMSCVHATFEQPIALEECKQLWNAFEGIDLPSAPLHPIYYTEDPNRPQPRLDRERENGMSVTVGRLRSCTIHSIRFIALSHNLIRGAAGGGVLLGELIAQKNHLFKKELV